MKVLVAQSCLTLCSTMDCSLPGSSVHGLLQAKILEWLAIPFSRASFWPRDQTWVSCIAGRFFTVWATREAHMYIYVYVRVYMYTDTASQPYIYIASQVALLVKNPHAKARDAGDPWVEKIPWRRAWQSTPVFLPGEFHRQKEPGGLQSMGWQRVGHDWARARTHTHTHTNNHWAVYLKLTWYL